MKKKGDYYELWNYEKSGADLRKVIMQAKGTSSGDCLRGTVYQLLNALYVNNVWRFWILY